MNTLSFPFSYIIWHYSKALKNILGIFSNFFGALNDFFSISIILSTFFSPWHRLDVTHEKNAGFEDFVGTIIVNTLMRIVGMIVRLFIIAIFLISTIALFAIEIAFFCAWILMPYIIFWLLITGIKTI